MSTESGLRVRVVERVASVTGLFSFRSVSWLLAQLVISVNNHPSAAPSWRVFSLKFMRWSTGSHVVYALQRTRRYKVISVDNHYNSFPIALTRVAQLACDALPENPTPAELESVEIDTYDCNLANSEQVRAIFEKYGKGGIWGVIHIAVCSPNP